MMTHTIGERLRHLAQACEAMGSQLYGTLLNTIADDYDSGGIIHTFFESRPSRGTSSRIGLRLLGAFHYCALAGFAPELALRFPSCGGDGDARAAWDAARALLSAEPERIGALFDRTPQTNEVARSTVLLGGLLAIAASTRLPIRLFEVGASAGLNTRLDRYRYEGESWSWGNSPVVLRNRERNGVPRYLDVELDVIERRACDLRPLDVRRSEDRLELESFIWADQLERFERLRRALKVAREIPVPIERADMISWIPRAVAAQVGSVGVIMHSVITEHLAASVRERLVEAIASVGARATSDAPIAWLRMEQTHSDYETSVTLWPSREEIPIARSDGHGQEIVWQ